MAVALYGVVVGGGATSWRKDGTVILVKDTGARMFYFGGQLHPVLNDTSAKLLAGDQMGIQVLGAKSLAGTPSGQAVGIVGAPEALPAVGSLSRASWSACVTQPPPMSSGTTPRVSLVVGAVPEATVLTGNQAVLATAPDRTTYLLWNGARWRLDTANGATAGLGYDSVPAVPVPASVLNILPAGADLSPPETPGAGDPGPTFTTGQATRIGQLFTGPGGEHYLLRRDGLVPLTAMLFALLRGDPATQRDAYGGQSVSAVAIGPADLARLRSTSGEVTDLTGGAALPAVPPAALSVPADQSLCLRAVPTGTTPTIGVALARSGVVAGVPPVMDPGVATSCGQADQVVIASGTGAVARGVSIGGGIDAVQYLVTDIGVKYPMSASGAKQLGYAGSVEVRLPDALLGLLPTGPVLDPQAVMAGGGASGPASPGLGACRP
jgi:type VII secretion protein EccB